ncbi:MAG TPA: hypothetical protein VKU60_14920, partial [Chloroflexota bacterium]|nr:hypothetical protein [Chloroflexota bacterium]
EDRPECLQRHHVGRRDFSDETVILCANCHACVSDPATDQQTPRGTPSEILWAEGLATLFTERARYLRRRLHAQPHG